MLTQIPFLQPWSTKQGRKLQTTLNRNLLHRPLHTEAVLEGEGEGELDTMAQGHRQVTMGTIRIRILRRSTLAEVQEGPIEEQQPDRT